MNLQAPVTPGGETTSRGRDGLLWLVLALVVAGAYGPVVVQHARRASDPWVFNDDVRQQIPPFFRYSDDRSGGDGYVDDYFLANFPLGYRAVYTTAAWLGDPVRASELLPYLLLVCTVVCLAITAGRLGGPVAGWASVALCLASSVYLSRMAGGLPRAFALPLLASFSTLLTLGRMRGAAALVCIGALFYPVAAFCSGVALAMALLLLPAGARGEAAEWSLWHRAALLVAVMITAAAVLLPVTLSARQYGSVLGPSDVAEYPEAGPEGRYTAKIAPPHPGFIHHVPEAAGSVVLGAGRPWVESTGSWARSEAGRPIWIGGVLLVAAIGWVRLCGRDAAALRVSMLLPASILSYEAARAVAPLLYVPHRYVFYPVALLATVVIPAGFAGFARHPERGRSGFRGRSLVAGIGCLTLFLLAGGRGDPAVGLEKEVDGDDPIYQALAELPDDSLIGGWPRGLMDNVPLVTGHSVLLSFETHQAFHEAFVLEMRRRMHAIVAAYFATRPEPMLHLRDRWGVTHLVVDRKILADEAATYFAPFDTAITAARRRGEREGFEVLRQEDQAAVFRRGDVMILELARVAPPGDSGAPAAPTRRAPERPR